MSRSALLGLMALIEGAAGVAVLLTPGMARSLLFGEALPGLTRTGMMALGLIMLGVALLCLMGWLRGITRWPFLIMLAYNLSGAAGLAAIGFLGGPVGPLFWPAALVHVALAGAQLWSMRTG